MDDVDAKDAKRVVSLTLQALAASEWFDGGFGVTLPPTLFQPTLYCVYSREAFRRYFRERFLYIKAFEEICRRQHIKFDSLDGTAWEELQTERPELVAAAHQLTNDPDFVVPIIDEVRARAEHYMLFVNDDTISNAITTGINLLVQNSTENTLDALRMGAGLGRRRAEERHRVTRRISRKSSSENANLKKGRRAGSKSTPSHFNYDKLCKYVRELWGDDGPEQKAVAMKLGYRGADPAERLRKALHYHKDRLKERGHSTHKWKQLCLEIQDFTIQRRKI